MDSLKIDFKSKSSIYFALVIILLGTVLIVSLSTFLIKKLYSTPAEYLPYLISAKPSILEWIYELIVLGAFLTIGGLILLFSLIFCKIKEESNTNQTIKKAN